MFPDECDAGETWRRGRKFLDVRATDQVGHEAFDTFTFIHRRPDTLIFSGPLAVAQTTTAVFDFESTYPDATFECKLDNALLWSTCSSPATYNNLAPGNHTFSVRAAGPLSILGLNADPTPAVWTWQVASGATASSSGDLEYSEAVAGSPWSAEVIDNYRAVFRESGEATR